VRRPGVFQGLLAKLGITKSYVFVNTFLYSVYGSVKAKTKKDTRLIGYRNRWLDALTANGRIEAVLALGTAADEAWQLWKKTPKGKAFKGAYAPVMHPTYPEAFRRMTRPTRRSNEEAFEKLERRLAAASDSNHTP